MIAAPKKKPNAPAASETLDINKPEDWVKIRARMSERVETAAARADKFFMTDEEIPLRQHLLLSAIAGFFFLFLLWANFATLDEVTRGQGTVVPSSEIQKMQSLEGGIIDEFLAHEGDSVKAGQPLIRMRDVQATSDLGQNRLKYLGLEAKIARLKAESEDAKTPTFPDEVMQGAPQSVQEEMDAFRANRHNVDTQTQVLRDQLAQKQQEISETETRIRDLKQVIALSQQQRDMTEPLVQRGSAPKMELIQLDQQIKEKETDLNSQTSSLPRMQAAVSEAKSRIAEAETSASAQAQTDLTAALAEANSLKETLSALQDKKTRTEIKSPVNGTVKEIKIKTVGGVVQPGADVIDIVPRDDELIVEARIKPQDIAFLHPGQQVMVKITAYDFSIYGGLKGELTDISPDAIANEKGETFYRVRVRTKQTYLMHYGKKLDIIPGMVATVDILTGKKTVMEYILKPFVKTLDSAMRER
jgi:adhesin transport system membrane fusion protein